MAMLTMEQKSNARPLPIFKPELRQAVREGRKTQTRRVVKYPLPDIKKIRERTGDGYSFLRCDDWEMPNCYRIVGPVGVVRQLMGDEWRSDLIKCPHGKPGDIAYMREPLWQHSDATCQIARYQDEPEFGIAKDDMVVEQWRGDRELARSDLIDSAEWSTGKWTSMAMPRGRLARSSE